MPTAAKRAPITSWLEKAPQPAFVIYATLAAFSTYFCMYAFRKPFTAGTYEGQEFGPFTFKNALVLSQLLGYTLSKFIGTKICSEVTRDRRAVSIVVFIFFAEAALVLFALAPLQWKVLAIFLNGIPLGMIWGLVVWYLEGRRTSELLLAGLSASFIVSSGAVKDVGLHVLREWGVSVWWMPAVTGALFLPVLLTSVWLLNQLPQPALADIVARAEREPMDWRLRQSFVRTFFPGLVLLIGAYFFLTAYRDFRDNFQREIFLGLGLDNVPGIFTRTETFVAVGVLVALALLFLVRDNRKGLLGAFAIMLVGVVLMGGSTLLRDSGAISGFWWMSLVGLGSYLAYVPYGSVLFDRLIASTRVAGTAVFAIYLADATGYCGSITVIVYRNFAESEVSWLDFFRAFTYFTSVIGIALIAAGGAYFLRRAGQSPAAPPLHQQDSSA